MTELERKETALFASMATRDLMSATNTLFEMCASKTIGSFIAAEINDIELSYVLLGRMISAMRKRDA